MRARIKSGCAGVQRRIHAALHALVPKSDTSGTFRFARSTEGSPTAIEHVVTTGIKSFDDRVGGMPVGKAIELVGLPQSGKTTMAIRIAVRAQQGHIYRREESTDGQIKLEKLKPGTFAVTVLYYDNEGSLSDKDKRTVEGVLLDAEILQCDTVELMWATMDKVVRILEDVESDSGVTQFLIVIIDTVGSLSTRAEYTLAWGKHDYPRVPQELKAGFRKMIGRMQRENVMLMGLNHVSRRMDLRGKTSMKAWAYTSPGGYAFSYWAYHRVFFEMLQVKYSLQGKGQDGYLVYYSTLKNRLAMPCREGRMALLFTVKDANGKTVREGGFYDAYSTLEALIYGKAAKVSRETGAVLFRFSAFGITPTTFGQADLPSLEEQEDAESVAKAGTGRRKRDPKIPNRAAWPAFYAQHQADCDALYEEMTRRTMSASDMEGSMPESEEEEEETGDEA